MVYLRISLVGEARAEHGGKTFTRKPIDQVEIPLVNQNWFSLAELVIARLGQLINHNIGKLRYQGIDIKVQDLDVKASEK